MHQSSVNQLGQCAGWTVCQTNLFHVSNVGIFLGPRQQFFQLELSLVDAIWEHVKQCIWDDKVKWQLTLDWYMGMQVVGTNKHHHQLDAIWQRGRSVWTGLLECLADWTIYVAATEHSTTLYTEHYTLHIADTTVQCTLHTWAHCTLPIHCTLHTAHCTLNTVNTAVHCSQAQSTNGFCSHLQLSTVAQCIVLQLNHREPPIPCKLALVQPKTGGNRAIAHVSSWTGVFRCHRRCTILSSNTF